MTEKIHNENSLPFGNPHNYQVAVITENHYHTSGQLLAEKGAAGLIVGDDRGRLTINFTNDDSRKYVEPDGSGRKIQTVPSHCLERLHFAYSAPRFDAVKEGYRHLLLLHLLSTGQRGAVDLDNGKILALTGKHDDVGFLQFDGAQHPLTDDDWDHQINNWKGLTEPHSMAFLNISVLPILGEEESESHSSMRDDSGFEPDFLEEDRSYHSRLLSRLISDCRFYLGMGAGNTKYLWEDSVAEQIDAMRTLWDGFPDDKKPEWTSVEEIDAFESQMMEVEEQASTPSLRPRC